MRGAFLLLTTAAAALRNVDRCEALLFSNGALCAGSTLRSGVQPLLDSAVADATLLAAIGPALPIDPPQLRRFQGGDDGASLFSAWSRTRASLRLMPDGFGGSDGFGSQPGGTEREPRAAWCVAVVTTFDECDAALRAGMRTLGLPAEDGGYVDEALEGVADACLDDLSELSGIECVGPSFNRLGIA